MTGSSTATGWSRTTRFAALAAVGVGLVFGAAACDPQTSSPSNNSDSDGGGGSQLDAEYEDGYDAGYGYGSVYGLDLSQDDECSGSTDYSPYCEGWLDGWRAGARD